MGVFTSIFKDRTCARCGGRYLCDFQIKTGDDSCEMFQDGDLVPEGTGVRGTFEAGFCPICNVCGAFLRREYDAMDKEARRLTLERGYEIRQVRFASHVFKDNARVGELFGHTFSTKRRGRKFCELEKALTDLWSRQIRAAALEKVMKVTRAWKKEFNWRGAGKGARIYYLRVIYEEPCLDAKVTIGRRFRVKIVEGKPS